MTRRSGPSAHIWTSGASAVGSPRRREQKRAAEDQLKAALLDGLNSLEGDQVVMLKLTLPDVDLTCTSILSSIRGCFVSLSSRAARAITEGLTAQQNDEEFNETLDAAITAIAKASST